jgi:hypothetical protein
MEILHGLREHDEYFVAKLDATGKVGLSSYQKCLAVIWQLAYGVRGNLVDDFLRMSKSTCLDALHKF